MSSPASTLFPLMMTVFQQGTGMVTSLMPWHNTFSTSRSQQHRFSPTHCMIRFATDFVRGYPFSLRSGVECMLSDGLWLNIADYDAPTQIVKPQDRHSRYVDAVLTVPLRAMVPVSGINVGFNREVMGPALFPGLRLAGEGKKRCETMEDICCGMCAKVVCDHLGFGVKAGMPYVWRGGGTDADAMESPKKEWDGVKLMESVVLFFQSVRLPRTTEKADDCVIEIAGMVRKELASVDPVFGQAADAMEEWIRIWRSVGSQTV